MSNPGRKRTYRGAGADLPGGCARGGALVNAVRSYQMQTKRKGAKLYHSAVRLVGHRAGQRAGQNIRVHKERSTGGRGSGPGAVLRIDPGEKPQSGSGQRRGGAGAAL